MFNEKRGQVTIFIVVAILIVAGVTLFFTVGRGLDITGGQETKNPEAFIQNCIEDKIEEAVELVSLQGGKIEPEGNGYFIEHDNSKIAYLCYTDEDFANCIVQTPLLEKSIEEEIKEYINPTISSCFSSLKESFEKRNYDVAMKKGEVKVDLLPKRVLTTMNYSVSMRKGDDYQSYESFVVVTKDNLYEFVSIANSMVDWETRYGEVPISNYMNVYHDLKVEKNLKSDKSKVYILTDRNTDKKFQFASRSYVIPSGGYSA